MIIVTLKAIKKNFKKYLDASIKGEEVVIIDNNKEVARLVSSCPEFSYLSDSLLGVLKNDYSNEEVRQIRTEKYLKQN